MAHAGVCLNKKLIKVDQKELQAKLEEGTLLVLKLKLLLISLTVTQVTTTS
jgi:hypothetical protein